MQIMNDYHNEVARVTEDMKPYLNQFIRFGNLSNLFESTKEKYIEKVLRQVVNQAIEIIVSIIMNLLYLMFFL